MDNNIVKKSKNNNYKRNNNYKNYRKNTLCINNEYMERKDKITSFFLNKDYKPMTQREIAGMLSIPREDMYILENILNELCDSRKNNF